MTNTLSDLFPEYLDPNSHAVTIGVMPEATYLLSLKWDSILFPRGCVTDEVITSAAAKNIILCALKLGRTSPVVIADDPSIGLAVNLVLWG